MRTGRNDNAATTAVPLDDICKQVGQSAAKIVGCDREDFALTLFFKLLGFKVEFTFGFCQDPVKLYFEMEILFWTLPAQKTFTLGVDTPTNILEDLLTVYVEGGAHNTFTLGVDAPTNIIEDLLTVHAEDS